jgi:hypothetical protein
MIAFLKSDHVKRPPLIDRPPREENSHDGFITTDFDEGAIVLKRKSDGQAYQLLWKKGSRKEDRRRALPAGDYQVISYRLARQDADGHDWFISGTGPIRNLKVHAGQVHDLKLHESIFLECRVRPHGGELQVQGIAQGEHHCGLSIWKDGRRIPLGFRITDAQNKELASGSLKYG